jgi:predicted phosphodiesterase
MITLLGDVHGNFERLSNLLAKTSGTIIQLGDLGIGFTYKKINPLWYFDESQPYTTSSLTNFEYSSRFKFIRGNHDNPKECQNNKNYLGDFGVYKKVFYISGAWSIDQQVRKVGVDWWEDEELSMNSCYKVLELYEQTKPGIVVSHDCPTTILKHLHHDTLQTRTGQLLQRLLDIHKPSQWIFAHHHVSWSADINGTAFKCLDIFETHKLKG